MGLIDFSESEIITWENADQSTDGTNASVNFLLAALLQGLRIINDILNNEGGE